MGDPATDRRRVVVLPYPGRGHINPMMSFCKLMASKRPDIDIRVIVTEEWLGLLTPDADVGYSASISFTTVPNVLPSEAVRGSDFVAFLEAVQTDLEGPVEEALDAIGAPIDLIIADSFLSWAVDIGKRRNTKVASFWPAAVLTFMIILHRHDLIPKLLAENVGEERVEIPGISSMRKVDLVQPVNKRLSNVGVKVISSATKADCVLVRSLDEFEAPAIHAMEAALSCPVFTIGPAIPYVKINTNPSLQDTEPSYIGWLSAQQERSVLYVSLGSFLSPSSPQMGELAAALKASNVPFLWVGRSQSCELSGVIGDKGMVVQWCDQMRVLGHPCVGGFLTHCGWNSTVEAAFAGVPALTFPLISEQLMNSKIIVEDCGIGWRVKDRLDEVVGREAIVALLRRFMDLNGSERKELDRACKELQARLLESVEEDGSTRGLDGFLSKMIAA